MFVSKIYSLFQSEPPKPLLKDRAKIDQQYKHWRLRVMYSCFIGYALFYFCRKNISIAMPALASDLGYSNVQLGLLGTVLYITYGVGKFLNGILADHANPRAFMVTGLILSALMNIFFGMSSSLWALAVFWGLNGWFQSMGFPPVAKLLANWYSASERGFKWSIWHVSHQIGGVIAAVMTGFLIQRYSWQTGFFVPSILCIITAVFLWNRLRDIPSTMGLPDVATYRNDIELNSDGTEVDEKPESIRYVVFHRVLNNKYIWMIGVMNMLLYIVRSGTFDWATKFLVEVKGSGIARAGIVTSVIELAGIAGPILAGVVSDKMKGRRGPICAISFALTVVGLILFYLVPPGHPYVDATALAIVGFWIYGPQFLQGVFVTDLASRKAASTAIGFTGGIFAYIGAAVSGVGTGWCIDNFGWRGGFAFWIAAAVGGGIIAAMLWNVSAKTHEIKHNS